ncbi:MAG: M23 family metallopeptidase [Gulosibacter sp.]|uniref:M23 family metallopeptidase n=1 Tax=Gulosibacter sp. TaxID=2817531 RepID=UPI003F925318
MIPNLSYRTISALLFVVVGIGFLPLSDAASATTNVEPMLPQPLAENSDAIWSWPINPIPDVLRPFDLPHPYGAGHRGIDLDASANTPILAPDDGVVHFVGWVVDRPVLSIAHPNGLLSSFEPVTAAVSKGDAVARGEVIGHLAVDSVHAPNGGLHLGARDGDTYIDPLALLGAVPRAVLLPIGN